MKNLSKKIKLDLLNNYKYYIPIVIFSIISSFGYIYFDYVDFSIISGKQGKLAKNNLLINMND